MECGCSDLHIILGSLVKHHKQYSIPCASVDKLGCTKHPRLKIVQGQVNSQANSTTKTHRLYLQIKRQYLEHRYSHLLQLVQRFLSSTVPELLE